MQKIAPYLILALLLPSCGDEEGSPFLDASSSLNNEMEMTDVLPDARVNEEGEADVADPPRVDTTLNRVDVSSGDVEAMEDVMDVAEADGKETPEPEQEGWGTTTEAPPVFAASDVSQTTIETTLQWVGIATEAWGQYGPLEIWIVGKDKDAVIELDEVWCERRQDLDPKWKIEWDCANGDPYESGNGWSPFFNYIEEGGAAVSVYRRAYIDYHFQTMTLSAKYPGPEEEDYRSVTMHEYFHVYQHAHIFDIQTNQGDDAREEKMGGKGKPWFAEGSAEFMSQLLYSRQPEAGPNHLKERMQWKYNSVGAYKDFGKRLEELTYSDPVPTYDIGTWFIAYLVHKNGEEAVKVGFYQDVDSLGFEGSFEKHFGQSATEAVDEFDEFLEQGLDAALAILPTE